MATTPGSAGAPSLWWEVVYTVTTGGGRSAYTSGHGIEVVQAPSSAAALALVQAQHSGAEGTVNGPYASKAAAQAQASADASAQAAGTETSSGGTGTSNNPKTNVNIPNPLTAIGNFFGDLAKSNTWIRVVKVVVGGVLLIVGLVHITGVSGAAADAVRKVPVPI